MNRPKSVERAQVRVAQTQQNHIGFTIRAFVRLEVHYQKTGLSWFEAKASIVREAIRQYLTQPDLILNPTT